MASISSATSGLASATGTWTGAVVPVVGDKVTVAHPGTSTLYTTLYQLNGAATAGATALPVDTGTGTIVAGECIKILHQTGTEDGSPTYDPTYYKVTVGITGAGTLTLATGLTYSVADNTQIINCGHVVEVDGTYHWGDDTSSATHTSNAIIVLGTLKFSRLVNSQLTCRGSIIRYRGITDMGCRGDRIPSGVTCTLIINESTVLAAGKHIFGAANSDDAQLLIRGFIKTRNTTLAGATLAGATSITVAASTGWAINDRIVLASPDTDATKSEVVTISGGSHPTWTVSAITYARASGLAVGNLSSNVVIKSFDGTKPGSTVFYPADAEYASVMLDVGDCRIENCSGGYWAGVSSTNLYAAAFAFRAPQVQFGRLCCSRLAMEQTAISPFQVTGINTSSATIEEFSISDYAIRLLPTSSSSRAFYCDGGAKYRLSGNIYAAVTGCVAATASPIIQGLIHGHTSALALETGANIDVSLADLRSNNYSVINPSPLSTINISASTLSGAAWLYSTVGTGTLVTLRADNCTWLGGLLTYTQVQFSKPSKQTTALLVDNNGTIGDVRLRTYWQETIADTTTTNRGLSSVKIKPNVANTLTPYIFTIPATNGVVQTITGFLRFDATYGTATPPVITLSGQGVSQTYTATATANTWHGFTFTFTPTSTGNITVTTTVQSTSTSGYVWLDGIYHDPMIRSTRHYGYLFELAAALTVDSRISLTEAAAAALPISVNHGTATITVTGPVTVSDLGHYCHYDLVLPANQDQASHFDFTATFFETTYTVVLSGAGAVTGNYTDANGSQASISAPNLPTGSRVQFYNVTGAAQISNAVLASPGATASLYYTGAAPTIRLRAAKLGELPIESFGVLTTAGLTFIDEFVTDDVYVAKGIDGSTVTEFTADEPNVQIDSNDPDGVSSVWRAYAWWRYYETLSLGIAGVLFNKAEAVDTENLAISSTIQLDNIHATPLKMNDGYMYRTDGVTIIASGSGSIQMDPKKAYGATGGGGGATAEDVWTYASRTLIPVGGVTHLY